MTESLSDKPKKLNAFQIIYLLFVAATLFFLLSFILGILFLFDACPNFLWGIPIVGALTASIMLYKPIMRNKPLTELRLSIALGLLLADLLLLSLYCSQSDVTSHSSFLPWLINFLIFWVPFLILLASFIVFFVQLVLGKNRSINLALMLLIFITFFHANSLLYGAALGATMVLLGVSFILYILFCSLKKNKNLFLVLSLLIGFLALLFQPNYFQGEDTSFIPFRITLLCVIQLIFALELYILYPVIREIAQKGCKTYLNERAPRFSAFMGKVGVWLKKTCVGIVNRVKKIDARKAASVLLVLGAMVLTYLIVYLILIAIFGS